MNIMSPSVNSERSWRLTMTMPSSIGVFKKLSIGFFGTGFGIATLKGMKSTTLRAIRARLRAIIFCRGEKDLVTVLAQLKEFVKFPYLLKLLWIFEPVGYAG